jgi:hypothetical protein
MTLESGKILQESRGEIAYGVSFVDYYAAEAVRPTSAGGGWITPTPFATNAGAPRGQVMAIQQAVGNTALITPWNFPIAMITRKGTLSFPFPRSSLHRKYRSLFFLLPFLFSFSFFHQSLRPWQQDVQRSSNRVS